MFMALGTVCLLLGLANPSANAAKKGTLRVSGDNNWVIFINGEKVAENGDWQKPTVSEFNLSASGSAIIAVYVHDAEPAAAGVGGFLADIVMDDKTYIKTGDKGWKCDAGKPIAERKDGWEKPNFDDKKWAELQLYEQFGAGVWGFGAAAMKAVLNNPDCTAKWSWCGPNNVSDDPYFRYQIGGGLAVDPRAKLTTLWASVKAAKR